MNKEEILEMNRKENRNHDEMEQNTFAKAGLMASVAGGLVCMVIILLEAIFGKGVSFSTWAVYLTMSGTILLMKYRGLGKKHELFFAIAQLALAALFLILFIIGLVKTNG
ncbi:MAG: DUF6442 family protein [Solobacterium sp.]|nr:DUF6442 family protein [Solobacterium sp.]